MAGLQELIEQSVRQALQDAFGAEYAGVNPAVRSANNPQFGDYQADLAMALAKRVGAPPREVAQRLISALNAPSWAAEISVAGPGFINFKISDEELIKQGQSLLTDIRLGVPHAEQAERVVVDYSSPNVAKEMHVGHLRATIIGDTIARVLAFLGHDVVRQNHVGDWGTQFGMLIQYLVEVPGAADTDAVGALNAIYQQAKQRFDEDADFAERARQRVVSLQGGDPESVKLWRRLVDLSEAYFHEVYQRLQVLLEPQDIRGESAYNDQLSGVVEALEQVGLASLSQGAVVVYPEGFKDRDGNPQPMIVRKADGGFLYATTDLAAARYRLNELKATRLVYVTDARQKDHFAMLFSILKQAGWASADVRLEHVAFGSVLGKDRKPFKTRAGGIIRLIELIEEAESRATEIIASKNPEMPAEQRTATAHVIGVGALKYADLASDRIKDYVFDWDKMLAFDGNTAPYLQNAYVRIQSIFRRGEVETTSLRDATIRLTDPHERSLLLLLLHYSRIVMQVGDSLEPHQLCGYLFDLATKFHHFYEHCPVLTAPDEDARRSRLALCDLTARTLAQGLNLLGIGVVEQM